MPSGDSAKAPEKKNPKETENVKKVFYISMFFDGTLNKMNTQQKTAQEVRACSTSTNLTQKDTNVAALSELAITVKEPVKENGVNKYFHSIYIEGPGTFYDVETKEEINSFSVWESITNYVSEKGEQIKAIKNNVLGLASGSAVGAWHGGVVDKVSRGVSKAYAYLTGKGIDWSKDEVHFSAYGFSRGAACARLFAYLVARGKSGANITYEAQFNEFLYGSAKSLFKGKRLTFLEKMPDNKHKVDFLGLYDTVSSIGLKDSETFQTHQLNATDYGLYSPQLPRVDCTLHIGAIDEYRKNFAITDVGETVPDKCAEIFVPGCHSDIGGSYAEGEESELCLNTEIDDKPALILTKDPRNTSVFETVSESSLVKLGWAVTGKTSTSWVRKIISSKRKVKRGISNVTLKTMWNMADNTLSSVYGRKPFCSYKSLKDFQVPEGLNSFDSQVNGSLPAKGTRKFIIPGGSLSSVEYRKLRYNYIHTKTNDSLGIRLVNGANWKGNLLCRIVYHGDKGDTAYHYMQDL